MPFLFGSRHPFQTVTPQQKPTLLFPLSELAGRYYCGDGTTNETLYLSDNQRFEYFSSSCLGPIEVSGGKWELDRDRLLLVVKRRDLQSPRSMMSTRFVPVKWERRIYLVDEHKVPDFCYRASQSTGLMASIRNEGRYCFDFLKFPTDKPDIIRIEQAYPPLPAGVPPRMPERYRTFYEQGPIRATVVKILPPAQQADIPKDSLRVLLDKGTTARLKPGLLLASQGESYANLIVTVTRADEAEAIRIDFADRPPYTVRVGDRFTSGDIHSYPSATHFDLPGWTAVWREYWNRSGV